MAAFEDGKYRTGVPRLRRRTPRRPGTGLRTPVDRPIRLRHVSRTGLHRHPGSHPARDGRRAGWAQARRRRHDRQPDGSTGDPRGRPTPMSTPSPATRIALEVFGQPFVNPAMLGGICRGYRVRSAWRPSRRPTFTASPASWARRTAAPRRWAMIDMGEGPQRRRRGAARTMLGMPAVNLDRAAAALGAPGRPLHFAAVVAPRTSMAYPTGGWRYNQPVVDPTPATAAGSARCTARIAAC